MLGFFIVLMVFSFLCWIGFKITGALLKTFFWLFILLPLALVFWGLGILCCCTLILIPVGTGLFKTGMKIMLP